MDVARAAGIGRSDVSRLERGRLHELRVDTVLKATIALGGRIDFVVRWQGGELDRLLNARHSALHDSVARFLGEQPGWEFAPEVSFAIRGERVVIDILAWHAPTKTLLVIELKTEIVDVNELMGTMDRKRRLATEVARERGWVAATVAVWLIIAESSTNRRRVSNHRATLRAAFPTDGRAMAGWLKQPVAAIRCLSFWSDASTARTKDSFATVKRVRRRDPRRDTLPRQANAPLASTRSGLD